MIKFKRYYTAFRRYNRSKGFGIHSPFAFNFVLKVLRERCPYYAYDDIHSSHWEASRLTTPKERRNLISFKYAKMIFRITCHFNPALILQIGSSHGIVSKTLLSVSSSSHLYSYNGVRHHHKIYESITSEITHRIHDFDDVSEAIENYYTSLNNIAPFIIVNHIDNNSKKVIDAATKAINNEGIIIVCNINKCSTMKKTWNEIKSTMNHGMSFSNEKIGIIVGYKHLPLQHFSLWF